MKPRSDAAAWRLERSECSVIRMWRLFVMCGVTERMIPVSLKFTVARGWFCWPPPPWPCESEVDHADRGFLANEDLCLTIVERHDARLRLNVGEPDFLKRVEERREVELPDRGREDQLSAGLTIREFAFAIAESALPPMSMMFVS